MTKFYLHHSHSSHVSLWT